MILLIRYKGAGGTLRGSKFKFHYDSINSEIQEEIKEILLHLNSIMILLIQTLF